MKYLVTIALFIAEIDENAAKNLITGWTTPIINIALFVIPFCGLIAALFAAIKWLQLEEEEREHRPLIKSLKRILFWTIVAELMTTIFKIFGLITG